MGPSVVIGTAVPLIARYVVEPEVSYNHSMFGKLAVTVMFGKLAVAVTGKGGDAVMQCTPRNHPATERWSSPTRAASVSSATSLVFASARGAMPWPTRRRSKMM